jgi:hypothetical protein
MLPDRSMATQSVFVVAVMLVNEMEDLVVELVSEVVVLEPVDTEVVLLAVLVELVCELVIVSVVEETQVVMLHVSSHS